MKVKKANIILITLFMFFFSMSNCLAYYASTFEETSTIITSAYEDLTFEFDQAVYGNNAPINIIVNNPNPYAVSYTFVFDNNITYQVDGSTVASYTVEANSAKTNVIVVSGVSGSNLEININVTSPYTESYTETIALDVEAPVGSVTSTNNQASSQTVTLNMTDNIGVSKYYFGTNESPSASDYTEIEATTLAVINETVDNNGTYYLFVKDVSGNTFNTSVDFYKIVLETEIGSVSLTSIVAKSGNEITLPTPTSSGGEIFLEWNTTEDGSGTSFVTSYTGSGNGSTRLYAVWEFEPLLYSVLAREANSGGYAVTYTGEHQDSYAGTGSENIYHYYTSSSSNVTILDKNNVIFAGFCWQMIRTTDTGGVKIIYNGEPEDGKCLKTRSNHVGFSGSRDTLTLASEYSTLVYYYGTSYTYDGSTFSLAGETKSATWGDNNYNDLLGLYTCKSSSETGTCSTLYYVESYYSSTAAYVLPITANVHYALIGTAINFNPNTYSLASSGYMYNKVYSQVSNSPSTTTYLYANSFTYSNGKYYLSGEQQTISDWSSNYSNLSNTHYTCWNTTGECETISYIYNTTSSNAYYIDLTGGKGVSEAIEEMLAADNVNTTDSTVKTIIDMWYEDNLLIYSSYLEDTVFCNDRSVSDFGGWNANGGNTTPNSVASLKYKEYTVSTDLSCTNETDRFSVANPKAQLTYPIGLVSAPEMNLLGSNSVRRTERSFFTMSPSYFASMNLIYATGSLADGSGMYDVRPMVSLAPGTEYVSGDGSMSNPYIIETKPIGSIIATNNQASSQTVTLNMTDNIGVNAYYFGTNASPSASDYTEIEATTLAVVNETVSNNGTYYLFVKDASGNTFNTSVEFYKVILDPTGGSVSPTSIVAKSGNEIKLPTPTSSDGSTFLSWNTASDGSGTEYTTNYTDSGNGSTTLYAIWDSRLLLYYILATEATSGSGLAQTYTGAHQDSYAGTGTENIYYYNATSDANATTILDKNNVIFAGFCWQMLRTTDTGGVKIIYNGEAVDGQCLNTRATHVGYGYQTSTSLSSTYYYGTSYTYNGSTFSLAGETKSAKWSDSTYQDLIGWFTCKSSSATGTCSTLYYVESYYTSSKAYVLPLTSGVHYSSIGSVEFNANTSSPSNVGYMHNTKYPSISKMDSSTAVSMLSRSSLSTNYYYAEEAVYGSPTASKYNLVSPYKVTSTSEYSSLVGKYTFRNSTETYTSSSVYYIADVDGSYMYYISLSSGKSLADVDTSYVFGDSYEDNGDGTYTLTNPVTVKKSEWYDNYESMKGKYTCNSASATCSNPLYVSSSSTYQYMYLENSANNYKYANSFTYENGKYYLSGTEQTFLDWNSNYNKLSNTHYTCWNTSGECDEISYIYYSGITGTIRAQYINIAGGKGVEEALEEILSVNTTNSTIKSVIDAWYKNNLLSYSSYLEDTVFCNDRSIRSLNGWNPNGGSTRSHLQFKEYNETSDLSCSNETDRFSVSNPKAQLTYPVGLATSPEMNLLGNNALRASGKAYWLASPYSFDGDANGRFVSETGFSGSYSVDNDRGVRPSVSLAPGTEYSSGDGSMANPYVVKMTTPSATITSTNNQASSQTVTLNMTDDDGVIAYYFGTNSNPSVNDYTEIETTSLAVVNETVSNNGTYYLFVRDVDGNTFNTSVDFYKVVLDTNGYNVSVSPTSIVAMSGNTIELPQIYLSYYPSAWCTNSSGSGTKYFETYTGSGNSSIILYARFDGGGSSS